MIRKTTFTFTVALLLSQLFNGKCYSQDSHQNPLDSAFYLRVIFVSFEGSLSETGVTLNWSTILESHLETYEVQRSTEDGNFITIGKIKAQGSGTLAALYSFKDLRPTSGKNIYRLKMIDSRKGEQYTPNKVINWGKSAVVINTSFKTYPNPAKKGNALNLIVDDPGNLVVNLFNLSGRKVFSKEVENDFSQNLSINVPSTLESGMYLVQIHNLENNKTVSSKIIVQ